MRVSEWLRKFQKPKQVKKLMAGEGTKKRKSVLRHGMVYADKYASRALDQFYEIDMTSLSRLREDRALCLISWFQTHYMVWNRFLQRLFFFTVLYHKTQLLDGTDIRKSTEAIEVRPECSIVTRKLLLGLRSLVFADLISAMTIALSANRTANILFFLSQRTVGIRSIFTYWEQLQKTQSLPIY